MVVANAKLPLLNKFNSTIMLTGQFAILSTFFACCCPCRWVNMKNCRCFARQIIIVVVERANGDIEYHSSPFCTKPILQFIFSLNSSVNRCWSIGWPSLPVAIKVNPSVIEGNTTIRTITSYTRHIHLPKSGNRFEKAKQIYSPLKCTLGMSIMGKLKVRWVYSQPKKGARLSSSATAVSHMSAAVGDSLCVNEWICNK